MLKMQGIWPKRADIAQEQLIQNYWNTKDHMMNQWFPSKVEDKEENFYYWWQAHVLDVWTDAYERTEDQDYLQLIRSLCDGVKKYNNNTFLHKYYDDMEWFALALLRIYEVTIDPYYLNEVELLWQDIQTAWNSNMGGGLAWNKDQLDYKNTPANAPASILASRLYHILGRDEDLAWSKKIYQWNKEVLTDPETGFILDGINRLGDGEIDYDWRFTYCQGVFIGAGLELYRLTDEKSYLDDAIRTAQVAKDAFVHPETKMLPDEGIDDTGLFKGIFVRYLTLLMLEIGDFSDWHNILTTNAVTLWEIGMDKTKGLIGTSWEHQPKGRIQLSVQLSGMMLIEAMDVLSKADL